MRHWSVVNGEGRMNDFILDVRLTVELVEAGRSDERWSIVIF